MIARRDKLMAAELLVAGLLCFLSQNVMTSALPSVMDELSIDAVTGQWLTTAYILVMGVVTSISAWLFTRFTTRRLELCAVGLFTVGCAIDLLAPNFPLLLLGRVIQAAGAGILALLIQVVLLYVFPPERQGQAMGLMGIVVGFAPVAAPTFAGLMVDAFGWRSIFLTFFLLSATAFAFGFFVMRDLGKQEKTRLDVTSVALYAVGFSSFMLSVNFLKSEGPLSPITLGLFALGVVCLAVFTRMQLRSEKPLLKLSLLARPELSVSTAMIGVAYVLMMAGTILIPLYIQTAAGHSASTSGLILLPGSLLIAFLSPVCGRLTDRFGARSVCVVGMCVLVLGSAAFILFDAKTSVATMVVAYAVRSVGLSLLVTPNTTLAVQSMSLADKPHASAIQNSLRQMSGALFSALLVLAASVASSGPELDMTGLHAVFAIMTGVAALGLLLAVFAAPKRVEVR